MTTLLFIAAIIGVIPALIASHKGYSFIMWWILGAVVFPLALILTLVMKDIRPRCPDCAEQVRREAVRCPHCHAEIGGRIVAKTI